MTSSTNRMTTADAARLIARCAAYMIAGTGVLIATPGLLLLWLGKLIYERVSA